MGRAVRGKDSGFTLSDMGDRGGFQAEGRHDHSSHDRPWERGDQRMMSYEPQILDMF